MRVGTSVGSSVAVSVAGTEVGVGCIGVKGVGMFVDVGVGVGVKVGPNIYPGPEAESAKLAIKIIWVNLGSFFIFPPNLF